MKNKEKIVTTNSMTNKLTLFFSPAMMKSLAEKTKQKK